MNESATTKKRQLSIMGVEGHSTVIWSIDDFDSIKNAKAMFDKLIASGFQAFSVDREEGSTSKGEKGEKVTKFRPSAQELVMVPPVSGG